MQINRSTPQARAESTDAAQAVLREARRLHRAATAGTLSKSLPVLRRILSSDTLIDISLPELFRNRSIEQLAHFELQQPEMGYPNVWFSTFSEAQDYARQHGGRCLRVGQQAVVWPER